MLFVIMFFGWYAFLGDCQPPNFTLPIRIPPILLDNAETIDRSCPSQSTDDIVDKEWTKTREILKNLYKPCNCGGPDWTSVLYLNMSDPDNSCPSNWKLHESPIRECGRKTDDIFTCDSVRIPVNINYSMICGRIYAYQRGESRAFHADVIVPIENSYLSGLSLTHGAVGKRKHVWTFVSAWDETSIRITPSYSCPCIDSTYNWTINFPLMWVTAISVILVHIPFTIGTDSRSSRMILCGMVRGVVGLAPAAVLIIHHGFVNTYNITQQIT